MRTSAISSLAALAAIIVAGVAYGCGSDDGASSGGTPDGGCVGFGCTADGAAPCVGLECKQVACEGGGTTSLSGVVLDPAGKVPVFNAVVYVPNEKVAPLTEGAACNRCDAPVSGKPVALTHTDTTGAFKLENVPVTEALPLVVQIGKWRREITVANVARCADTPLAAGTVRLPRNREEGDIPRIAVATGAADPLQCLLKKVGLDDSEFGVAGSEARVHLYVGGGFDDNGTIRNASSQLQGGAAFASAEALWGTTAELSKYDVVLLACEGHENDTAEHKAPAAKQALYDYAKAGGRVFTTHFHHTFFSGSPDAAPKGVAQWSEKPPPAAGDPKTTPVAADFVGTFDKAVAMKTWLEQQGALENGKLPMLDARHNADAVNAGGLAWIAAPNANLPGENALQYLTFNAPVGASDADVCGRVVFSNLHVGAGTEGSLVDDPSAPFPTSCQTQNLSPQQKALEFMLFDLSSCVQLDDAPIAGVR